MSLPIGRPTANQFPILIKTRNRSIHFFLWRRELALAVIAVYFSNEFESIIERQNRHIALKTSAMRFLWRLYLVNAFRVGVRQAPFKVRVSINNTDVSNISRGKAKYLKHHVKAHSEFNKAFSDGYTKPTTLNTFPIDRLEYILGLGPKILLEYGREFKKRGLIL